MKVVVLVTGAAGQIGRELVPALKKLHGEANVVSCFNRAPVEEPRVHLDVTSKEQWRRVLAEVRPQHVYHLASLLSGTSEQKPQLAYEVNLNSLRYLLELCEEEEEDCSVQRVFFPSSIGAFGAGSGKVPRQDCCLDPTSLYGVLKVAGNWENNSSASWSALPRISSRRAAA